MRQKKVKKTKQKVKQSRQERQRGFRPNVNTWVNQTLYKLFIKNIVGRQLTNSGVITDAQSFFKTAVESFFLVDERDVRICRAKLPFNIPGPRWESLSNPSRLIPGDGVRHVPVGATFVLRTDIDMPERSELEFKDQVFVLSGAQLNALREKFEDVT